MEMEIETKIESAHVLFCCCAPWILYCPNRARMYFYMQLSVPCVSARNGQLQIRGARQTNCMCARLPMQKHRRAFHRIDDIRLTGNIWYQIRLRRIQCTNFKALTSLVTSDFIRSFINFKNPARPIVKAATGKFASIIIIEQLHVVFRKMRVYLKSGTRVSNQYQGEVSECYRNFTTLGHYTISYILTLLHLPLMFPLAL